METIQSPITPAVKTSGFAITSIVTGLTCLSPLAIIFGHLALSQIKKSAGEIKGSGLALAGMILGYVSLIVTIVSLIILFSSAKAWKNDANESEYRAACFAQTNEIQIAIRAYQGANALNVGDPIDWNEIYGPNGVLQVRPTCLGGGTYTFADSIPPFGTLGSKCSNLDHVPSNHPN